MEEHHKFEGLLLLLLLCSYFSTFTSFGWTAVNFSHAPAAAFQTFSSTLLFVLQELVLPSTLLPLCVSWYSLRQSLTFFGALGCFLLVPKKFRQRNVKKHWTIPKCIQISFLKGKNWESGSISNFFLNFLTTFNFQTSSVSGELSTSTMTYTPRSEDSDKTLHCRATNPEMHQGVLEDQWKLDVQCKSVGWCLEEDAKLRVA